MFTGIIEEIGTVRRLDTNGLTINACEVVPDLEHGSSISVNGACLTVTSKSESSFSVDVIPETLRRTNLGGLSVGSPVNLERPLSVSGRFDGHIVQGHVDGTAPIESIIREENAILVVLRYTDYMSRYVVEKGFIAIDGTSLTVVDCDESRFRVSIIPFTRNNTILGTNKVGDLVNIELDILAKYVERFTSRENPLGQAEDYA